MNEMIFNIERVTKGCDDISCESISLHKEEDGDFLAVNINDNEIFYIDINEAAKLRDALDNWVKERNKK
jgi:hypothetical protein